MHGTEVARPHFRVAGADWKRLQGKKKRAKGTGQSVTVVGMLWAYERKETTRNKQTKEEAVPGGAPRAKMEPDRGETVADRAENSGSQSRKKTVQSQNAGLFARQDAGPELHITKKGGIPTFDMDLRIVQ